MPNPKFDAKETKMDGVLNCNVCRYHPSNFHLTMFGYLMQPSNHAYK